MDRLRSWLEALADFTLPPTNVAVDWKTLLAYAFGIVVVYLIIRLLMPPMRFTARLAVNALVGIVLLLTYNLVGSFFNQAMPLNPITVLIAGFLGVPGVALLVALRYVYGVA